MALLGLLSLLQIIALPGHLLLRTLRIGRGILGTSILTFAASLVINHVLVAGLVILGIYRPAFVYAVFTVELLLLLALDGQWLRVGLAEVIAAWRQRMCLFFRAIGNAGIVAADAGACDRDAPLALRRMLLIAVVLVIAGFALSGIAQFGQIFQQWDAVVSWNRWAVDWAANRLPYATSFYPQLLPTNLSLSYVFMQSSELWIFAKSFQFLFCLMLLLAMLDLARVEGRVGYVPGVVITYVLLVALLRFRMLSSGYADVPLAFFGLATVYTLMLARSSDESADRLKYLYLGALLATGAAWTKQTGLYIVAVYPLLAWRFVLRADGPRGLRSHLPLLLRIALLLGLLASPWYLYKFFDFHAGSDTNNTVLLVSDFHQGRGFLQRLSYAGSMIVQATTPIGAVLLLIAVAISLRDPLQRWLVGVFVVPLGLIWAIGFSYDLRNLALIIPFVGAAAGCGLIQIVSWIIVLVQDIRRTVGWAERAPTGHHACMVGGGRRVPPKRGWWDSPRLGPPYGSPLSTSNPRTASSPGCLRVGHVLGMLTLLLMGVSLCVSNEKLLDWQRRLQRSVGVPELDRQLYAYAADHPCDSTIATDYQAMRWLPELGRRSMVCTCDRLSAFRQTFDRPEVRYLLVRTEGAAAEVRAFLESQNAVQLIFENHGFAFYEKRQREPPKVATVQ